MFIAAGSAAGGAVLLIVILITIAIVVLLKRRARSKAIGVFFDQCQQILVIPEDLKPFEMSSGSLEFGEQLGEGQFGKVLRASARQLPLTKKRNVFVEHVHYFSQFDSIAELWL